MTSPYQQPISFTSPVARDSPAAPSTSVSDLPQQQVDAIIRTKRKAREPKACYPCHARKVKCDRNLPCDGCVKRDHANLCSYERPSKKRAVPGAETLGDAPFGEPAVKEEHAESRYNVDSIQLNHEPTFNRPSGLASSSGVSVAREEWDNVRDKLKDMESTIYNLRMRLDKVDNGQGSGLETGSVQTADASSRSKGASPEREGIHATNTLGEGTVHLGSRSVLAYILNSKSSPDQTQALLEGGILPKLGLDNESATYPFVDLWSSDMSSFDVSAVCSALPNDQQCKMFFYYYRDIAGAIYPVLEDVNAFEVSLNLLLQNRAALGGVYRSENDTTQKPFGTSVAYLGLLFAVLASGCQSSDVPSKERELTSQVYVCCSYQCLRMTNFLSQPTIEAIQTLLVIGNVLSYNMNPGISYVLLGMTLRMGLAIGLHVESSRFQPAERYRRRHVWWSMAWQDSHFSLSYDRPSTTAVSQPDIAYREDSKPGELLYFETLCRVIALALEVVRSRMLSPHSQMSFKTIQAYKEKIQQIMVEAKPSLRNRDYCYTPKEHLERVVLKLHSSYFASELCRPALKTSADMKDPITSSMRSDCVSNLMKTVEAYIEMHQISIHAARSWITLQRAISSIFLLAVIEESKSDPHFLTLLEQLKIIIAQRANSEIYESSAAVSDPELASTVNTIPGTTNTTAANPAAINATDPVPASVASDTQAQWAKPLTKTLRALEKLSAAFNNPSRPTGVSPGLSPYMNTNATSASMNSLVMPASTAGLTPTMGSLPPTTPESSTSGEWSIPNLLDRAAEYIHPPLWG